MRPGRTVALILKPNGSKDAFPPKECPFGSHKNGWRHMGKICPTNSPKRGVNSKPKRQNLYMAISLELLIGRTSDLRTEFEPWKALRGWSAITPKQIQHRWWPPSWKSIRRHISAVDVSILTKFGSGVQNDMEIMAKWSWWKPEVELQYGRRLSSKTGSSYISAVNWVMSTKFGLLIDYGLLRAATSMNPKPAAVLSGHDRHLEK